MSKFFRRSIVHPQVLGESSRGVGHVACAARASLYMFICKCVCVCATARAAAFYVSGRSVGVSPIRRSQLYLVIPFVSAYSWAPKGGGRSAKYSIS